MGEVYYWTGALVIWGLVALVSFLAVYLIVWRFIGYIVGWFRICRLQGQSPWKWFMVRWACKKVIAFDDGWYRDMEAGQVPLYGFAKIKPHRIIG